jgi:hypothetical protein
MPIWRTWLPEEASTYGLCSLLGIPGSVKMDVGNLWKRIACHGSFLLLPWNQMTGTKTRCILHNVLWWKISFCPHILLHAKLNLWVHNILKSWKTDSHVARSTKSVIRYYDDSVMLFSKHLLEIWPLRCWCISYFLFCFVFDQCSFRTGILIN